MKKNRSTYHSFLVFFGIVAIAHAQEEPKDPAIYGTITEKTPSIPEYFSWINNTNEGASEAQTMFNLEFFKWLNDEYGMQLGIYAWDAGNIDSANYYGSMETEKFKKQYPNGWGGIADLAKSFDCRLGLWGGPDGFGNTPEEEQARRELLVSFCRDYGLQLFKFDSVCTQLRDEKQDAFAQTMTECRKYAPDLVVLNHRLNLGDAKPHATTFLWGGAETYIDVHMVNNMTATHNRAMALSRGLPPGLQRLTEDHGVCISSCLDGWEDDLILQAFNRNLILAPQIYGNPWLLRDDEFPKLARIFNLHFRNREILVDGLVLPEKYGKNAVSRGDASTRFITLRNISWEPKMIEVVLNEEIGLSEKGKIEVRRHHPSESVLGTFSYGETVKVEVAPFRSYLLMVSAKASEEISVLGCDYEVVRDTEGKPALVKLLGQPGTTADVSLKLGGNTFSKAFLNGEAADGILSELAKVKFPGEDVASPWHKKLGDLSPVDVPADAEQLYEATCFRAVNSALEVQSLERSGDTSIPQVKEARDAFFEQEYFWRRGVWDKYLFDGKLETFLGVASNGRDQRLDGGALRVDFGKVESVDEISINALWQVDPKNESPAQLSAEVSEDLVSWKKVTFEYTESSKEKIQVARIGANGGTMNLFPTEVHSWSLALEKDQKVRYVRVFNAPDRVAEFSVFVGGKQLDGTGWNATQLFAPFGKAAPVAAWEAAGIEIDKNAAEGSYLCVAIEGKHGSNKAFAALRVDGKTVGAPQRAPSFPCVSWEYPARQVDLNNTYYFPVTPEMRGKKVDVVVLGLAGGHTQIKPHVWITADKAPLGSVLLRLEK
ncbi:MAG: discoidin domain-containing protein [Luteolibacter sp.]